MSAPRRRQKPLTKGCKADIALDLWAAGFISSVIAKRLHWKVGTLRRVIMQFRKEGDPRAVKRKPGRTRNSECINRRTS